MMEHNLNSVASRMHALSLRVQEGIERKITTAATVTAAEAIRGTPVDTGRARASFQVGIDNEPSGDRPPFAPYPALFSKRATFAAGRHLETSNALAAIADAEQTLRGYRLGQRIYLVNSVSDPETGEHYLSLLDTVPGYSLQPPALAGLFFLERALDEGLEASRGVKVLP